MTLLVRGMGVFAHRDYVHCVWSAAAVRRALFVGDFVCLPATKYLRSSVSRVSSSFVLCSRNSIYVCFIHSIQTVQEKYYYEIPTDSNVSLPLAFVVCIHSVSMARNRIGEIYS